MVPAYLKKHPILGRLANRYQPEAWLIAADMEEDGGNLPLAETLRKGGIAFAAIVRTVSDAIAQSEESRKRATCFGDLPGCGYVQCNACKKQVTMFVRKSGQKHSTQYNLIRSAAEARPEYLARRIVNEILAN